MNILHTISNRVWPNYVDTFSSHYRLWHYILQVGNNIIYQVITKNQRQNDRVRSLIGKLDTNIQLLGTGK